MAGQARADPRRDILGAVFHRHVRRARRDDSVGHLFEFPSASPGALGPLLPPRNDLEHPDQPVLARRRHLVPPPNVPRRPRHIPHQRPVAPQLRRKIKLLGRRAPQTHRVRDLLGAPDARLAHARDDQAQGVARHALAHRAKARLAIRIEDDAEADLLAAARLLAHVHAVQLRPGRHVLRLLVLVDRQLRVAVQQREVRVPGRRAVLDGEAEEARARRAARLPDWAPVRRVEAPALVGRERGILDPQLEAAVGADRGEEVRVERWGQPLEFEDLAAVVRAPGVAERPAAVVVPVEDFDLAVGGAAGEARARGVEGGGFDKVAVRGGEELESVGGRGRDFGVGCHGCMDLGWLAGWWCEG